ncbi:hypothetical protein [Xanthomonas sp. GPE 39]|uniref:hypothetical protein n=1 Tax=Xanthomonas sp. GPE 39 TaxID=1583099 RepID=UPI001269D6BB|nr:hypothetical protein [Xanthomonas sp. GPE 39]
MKIDSKYMKLRAFILCTMLALAAGTSISANAQQIPAGPYIVTHLLNYNPSAKAMLIYTATGIFCVPLRTGTSVRGPFLTVGISDHSEFYAMSSPYCAAGSAINGLSTETVFDRFIPSVYLVVGSSDIRTAVR